MKQLLALAPLALLGGCLTHPDPPPPPYHAVGTEPFWNLLIDPINITFTRPEEAPVSVPTPKVDHGVAGEIYQAGRIRVNVVHGQCSDGMSDRVYPDRVQVWIDGKSYNGCGGL